MRKIWLLVALLGLGCGESHLLGDASADTRARMDARTDAGGGDVGDPDAPTDRVIELVGGEWAMPRGAEGYVCVRRTMEETVFVREFRPVAPLGTHHTVVTATTGSTEPDGVTPCSAFTNGADMIFGSGVGTENLRMPEGVAVRIEAGQQVLLNLHLFNGDRRRLTGYSAIEAVLLDEAEVEHEAEVFLAGTEFFSIPARASDFELDGRCTMRRPASVFAVMPHMHTLGTFMRVTANPGGAVLHEAFYSFDDQRYTTFDTLDLDTGDTIDVTCRYDNPSDSNVGFGDSTLSEMCYAAVYRYPVGGAGSIRCTN